MLGVTPSRRSGAAGALGCAVTGGGLCGGCLAGIDSCTDTETPPPPASAGICTLGQLRGKPQERTVAPHTDHHRTFQRGLWEGSTLLEPNSGVASVTQPVPPAAHSVCSESGLPCWTNSSRRDKLLDRLLQPESEGLAETSFAAFLKVQRHQNAR